MKNLSLTFITTAFLTVLFVSCANKTDEKEQQAQDNIELEEEEVLISQETVKMNGKRLHPGFNVTEYCDREDQDSVMFYWGKFGNKTAFNILMEQENNQLKVTYRIIEDCCLRFSGQASMDSAKLNLFHLKRAGNPCECKCMYEFVFLFKDMDIPDKLFIKNQEVQF